MPEISRFPGIGGRTAAPDRAAGVDAAIPRVVKAKHLGDFRVLLSFSDGLEGVIDLRNDLWGEVFEPLRDPAYFSRFEVDDTKYGTSTLYDLPKGPLPSGQGINVYVDATAWVEGSCDIWQWNGSACTYQGWTEENTIFRLTGKWSKPGDPPDRWTSYEYAIDANGNWVDVQSSPWTPPLGAGGPPRRALAFLAGA